MTTAYIISQVFVVVGYLLFAITYLLKNRVPILFINIISSIAYTLGYLFLNAWAGMAMNLFAVSRNAILLIQNRYKKSTKTTKSDYIILAILCAVIIALAVVTYDGFWSLMSIFATILYTISTWHKNTRVYKIIGIFVSLFWLIYNIYVYSLFGIILESLVLVSIIIGNIYELKKNKKFEL
jgi:hypothetical protein